jgi:hypothetical protein
MERTKLLEILHGNIALIDSVNVKDIALYSTQVTIFPKDVKKILLEYLRNKLNADDLIKWATFICARAEYTCPNWQDDEKSDYYEDMMYVIQKLSTPQIDGDINVERITQYFTELKKYADD